MAVFEVRGEPAVVSGEMGAGARHEGGEAGDGVEHDMSGSVTEGVLESIHDLPAVIDREAFVRERWAGDVAAIVLFFHYCFFLFPAGRSIQEDTELVAVTLRRSINRTVRTWVINMFMPLVL